MDTPCGVYSEIQVYPFPEIQLWSEICIVYDAQHLLGYMYSFFVAVFHKNTSCFLKVCRNVAMLDDMLLQASLSTDQLRH